MKAVGEEAKGIGNSTTLSEDAKTEEEAKKVLLMLAQSVGRRLRKAGKKAGSITVEIRYATFRNVSHQMQVTPSAQSDTILYQRACELFWRTLGRDADTAPWDSCFPAGRGERAPADESL